MPRAVGRKDFSHEDVQPGQFTAEEGVMGLDDMVGQVRRGSSRSNRSGRSLVRLSQVALGDLGHDAVDVKRRSAHASASGVAPWQQ